MWNKLYNDETGAIVSIELILIITIAVLGLIVGWSEVAHAVNTELDDISNAVGKFNQTYYFGGFHSYKGNMGWGTPTALYYGSSFVDGRDDCDGNCSGVSDITCCHALNNESIPGVGYHISGSTGYTPGSAPTCNITSGPTSIAPSTPVPAREPAVIVVPTPHCDVPK